MKTKLILFISLLLFVGNCWGQVTFQRKIINSVGACITNAVQQTNDGGYILTGSAWDYYQANSGFVYLIKTNEDGDTLWTKTYGGSYGGAYGSNGQQTTDGGYIIIGNMVELLAGATFGNQHIYAVKTNSTGDTLWTKAFGGDSNDIGNSIYQTNDSGYIMTGYTESFGAGGQDVYLLKIDVKGNIIWTKTYGGSNNEVGYCVKQTSDSGYIVCGTTTSFGDTNGVVYLIKTKANGDTLWTKTYGGTNNDGGNSVQQTKDGGYIIAGFNGYQALDSGNIYLIRTKANGDTLWTKTYGPVSGNCLTAVAITSDSGYIITSSPNDLAISDANAYLIKTNSAGDTLWTKTYGGAQTNIGYSVQQTSDGGYIIAGFTDNFSAGLLIPGIYLIKTDADGNSGCNQKSSTNIIVNSTVTEVSSTNTIVDSGGIASPTVTFIGSGGNDSTLCLTTGISELTINNTISLYPNPATDQLIINGNWSEGLRTPAEQESKAMKLTIYNMLGEAIYTNVLNSKLSTVNCKPFPSGVYFVTIADENEQWVGRFVKE